jgi:FeS assembly SUF system regulator
MLRLSKMTDYAVVVMGQLASRPDCRQSAASIAEKTGLPTATVGQVLKALSISNLVDGTRGAYGGYLLSRSPSAISVAEIVVAMDGPVAITACVDGADDPCNVQAGCLLRGSWDAVNSAIEGALKGVTLEDMLAPLFRFSVSKSSELEVRS